ncbi:MAG: endonuclease III [Ruminococcaceae bacterium]|nr:endonuclease III [Oscillospiraceae bacterium]
MWLMQRDVGKMIEILEALYPDPVCSLDYEEPWQLLFSARLAAQCTDARVNTVTPGLFAKFPTLEAFAVADVAEVEEIVHPCGFFRSKARDLVACAAKLLSEYGGELPDTVEELVKLPGVGRKTANLIVGDIFHKPAIVTDTHCIRISNRLGLCNVKEPVKVERALREILPPEKGSDFCHRLVLFGRDICTARAPRCGDCPLMALCAEQEKQHG